MQFRVLGSVGIADADQLLPVGGGQPRRLLAILLAYRNSVVGTERLVDILWDDPPDGATATLQSYVSKLRRFVELAGAPVRLVSRPPGYVLEVPGDRVDAGIFEHALGEGHAHIERDPQRALECIDVALAQWRGAAYAEFADAEWVRPEAVRLEELRVTAEEARADAQLRIGRHDAAVGPLEALVVAHPLRERLWMQLMLALYRSGRQPDALRCAQSYRTHVRDELGLEPSSALRDLETAILQASPDLDWSPPPIEPGSDAWTASRCGPATVLPAETTTLIGRERDLERAARLFEGGRILTLFGPGGVGKTRLAYRLAANLASKFERGLRVVELAPLRDPSAVVSAVADVLDVQQRLNRSLEDSIIDLVGAQRLLIVIDNCEHVLDGISTLVDTLLKWCPNLHVLATSREPLGIPGEVVWSVPPLPVPARDDVDARETSPAVQLFVERTRATGADFVLDEATLASVVEICIRLDGLPLAIELAAARMRSMSPAQVAERLPEGFRVLAGPRRVRDPRHRTLHDLVRWSFELLTPAEQRLFERISLFAGWFDLDRVERAAPDERVADGLATLVDKSMLGARQEGGVARFRMLETLREFGRDALDARPESAHVRAAHVSMHVDLAEQLATGLFGPDEARCARDLDDAFDDLRESHTAALAGSDLDHALRLVAALSEYAFRRIRYEVLTWAEATLDDPAAGSHPLGPVALGMVAYGRFVRGDLDDAFAIGERAVEAAARLRVPTLGIAERAIGNALFYLGREGDALTWMDRLLEAADATGLGGIATQAYYMRSVAETSVGDRDGGELLATRAMTLAEGCQSPTARAEAAYALGIALERSRPDLALDLLDECVGHAETVDNRWIRAFALTESLWMRASRGDRVAALRGYRSVVDTWFRGGDWANLWLSLRYVFAIFETLELDETAATMFGALDAAGVMRALPLEPANADAFARATERVTERLGAERFTKAASQGRAMRDEEVVRYTRDAIDQITAREEAAPPASP